MVGLDKPLARIWVSSGAQNKRFAPMYKVEGLAWWG